MITTERDPAALVAHATTPLTSPAGSSQLLGIASDPGRAVDHIDDVTIDRIAANLLGMMPGTSAALPSGGLQGGPQGRPSGVPAGMPIGGSSSVPAGVPTGSPSYYFLSPSHAPSSAAANPRLSRSAATTSASKRDPLAGDATPLPTASSQRVGGGSDPGPTRERLDDATMDRIAASVLGMVPGMPAPVPPAVSHGVPSGLPTGTGVPAGVPRGVAPGAVVPQATATAVTVPERIPGASIGGFVPALAIRSIALPPLDGSLSPLFEQAVRSPSTTASPHYLLSPPAASAAPLLSRRQFDVWEIRRDFPILEERVHGKRLVWLDNAATTQKPRAVIDRMVHYYEHEYSNVHRGAHELAARSTDAFEGAREKVARFLGAATPSEIVFARGTTEAVNLVANSWGRKHLVEGDEIVLTTLEHHSNIVPWQFVADAVGAKLRIVPVTDRGEVLLGEYEKLLGPHTKLVAITHVSNALGTVLPVREMVQVAHRWGARVLVDGAQAVAHFPVNVQALDADFYVLSGHKLFAPTGVGVLYGKKALLDEMPPWQGGGNMIQDVTFERSTFADPPQRFEAGTAMLAQAVGLGAAVDYLESIGMETIAWHERELMAYATDRLNRIPGLTPIGTAPEKAGVVSFVVDGMSVEEMGKFLDQEGIAVRAGHHCAQPTMARFGLTSTVRPSMAFYNTHEEIDVLVRAIRKALQK